MPDDILHLHVVVPISRQLIEESEPDSAGAAVGFLARELASKVTVKLMRALNDLPEHARVAALDALTVQGVFRA